MQPSAVSSTFSSLMSLQDAQMHGKAMSATCQLRNRCNQSGQQHSGQLDVPAAYTIAQYNSINTSATEAKIGKVDAAVTS
jgi:hypothetical protein